MSEEQDRLLREGDSFLASQVSFDIDEPQKPVRRRAKKEASGKTAKKRVDDGHVTECLGCAAEIPEGEFVEAILSFVTGAADYLAGDPVRVRSVQMLQQLVSQGRLPDPHSEWSSEVVQRIEQMADERARLMQRQEEGYIDGFPQLGLNVEEIKDSLRAEIEQEIVGQVAVAIRDQVRQQVVEEMVPIIRVEVEKELWAEFEEAMRNERAKHDSSE